VGLSGSGLGYGRRKRGEGGRVGLIDGGGRICDGYDGVGDVGRGSGMLCSGFGVANENASGNGSGVSVNGV
jgi:hypothetical protein